MKHIKQIVKGTTNLVKKRVNLLDKEVADLSNRRMAICRRCPELTQMNTCDLCGCYMPSKTLVTEATCPDKQW